MIFNVNSGAGKKLPVLSEEYPKDVSSNVGDSVTFTVAIAEDGRPDEYSYQWYYDGAMVTDASGSSYTRNAESGSHSVYCIVTNKAGAVMSRTATVTAEKLYLIKNGQLNQTVTGGLSRIGVKRNSSYGNPANPNVTYNSDNIYIEAPSENAGGVAYFTNKISLSDYTKLHFSGKMTHADSNTPTDVMIGIWSAFGTTVYDNLKGSVNGASTAERVIDTSGLSGSYHVGFWVFWPHRGNATITANDVWLT